MSTDVGIARVARQTRLPRAATSARDAASAPLSAPPPRSPGPDLRAAVRATAWWAVASVVGVAVVVYLVGALIAAREQRSLLAGFRDDVSRAVGSVSDSLRGASPVTRSPALGDPVALVQIQRLGVQQVAVEGADPARTRSAPGHLPGTAGIGQPGNAVLTGRSLTFGRSFGRLNELRVGDQVVATTTQGQSLYVVQSVRSDVPVTDAVADAGPEDRLTLITSSSWLPWSGDTATVVVAELKTRPFTPTPQNGRADNQNGRSGDPSALPLAVLCALAFVGTAVTATVLYQRWSIPGTYVVTTPALVALLVFAALAASSLLPAWA